MFRRSLLVPLGMATVVVAALALVFRMGGLGGQADVEAGAPVPNDDFANATVISSLPFAEIVDTGGSTVAPSDPPLGTLTYGSSVWYTYTPTTNHTITIVSRESLYAVGFAVFTGAEGALQHKATALPGTPPDFTALHMPVTANIPYHVMVFAEGGGGGDILSFRMSLRDGDFDGVEDVADNCAGTANPDQANIDGDNLGDACDVDNDNDSFRDSTEERYGSNRLDAASVPENNDANPGACADGVDNDGDSDIDAADGSCDSDSDGRFDELDNCPEDANLDQLNFDGDSRGDACDFNDDNDNAGDEEEEWFGSNPFDRLSTPEHIDYWLSRCDDVIDNDLDGLVDADDPGCQEQEDPPTPTRTPDPDIDGDGYLNELDNCPFKSNGQDDQDGDDIGDVCDTDRDGDGFSNQAEFSSGSFFSNPASTPEHEQTNSGSCSDGADNDLDGAVDALDTGCTGLPEADFSMGVDLNGDLVDDCGTASAAPDLCVIERGSQFRLRFYLNQLPFQSPTYGGIELVQNVTGVVPVRGPGSPSLASWPDCVYQAVATEPGLLAFSCAIGVARPASSYVGLVGTADLRCYDSGAVAMGFGIGETQIVVAQGGDALSPFTESGPSEVLSIECITGAPIPPTVTPSPTPTATPTSEPDPQGGDPDESGMALRVYGDTAKQQLVCAKGPQARACDVGDGTFSVDVHTNTGPTSGFLGYQAVLQYSGAITLVDQNGLAENRWPRCAGMGVEQLAAPESGAPGRYTVGCAAVTSQPPMTYEGALANVHFACSGSGTGLVSLIGGGGANVSFYHRPSINGNRIFLSSAGHAGQQLADSVVIECGSASVGAAGVDTDGDGCADAREQNANERLGGRRDYLNPWDFFEPTGDRKHRIDDVLSVVADYFTSDGDADYSAGSDRTALGPNAWNLGAPNGTVRIDDILAVIKLYFHDCA